MLLLVVAGVAIGIAAVLFSGGETAARDPWETDTAALPSGKAPVAGPSSEDGQLDAGSGHDADSPAERGASAAGEGSSDTGSASDRALPEGAEEIAGSAPPDGLVGYPRAPASAGSGPPTAAAVDEPAVAGDAAALIEQLRPLVAEPDADVPDYDRDRFAAWLDADRDCVNTRHEILQSEAVDYSMNARGCAVEAGEWFDPYTDRTYADPRDLDVDHVVALADAWVSGAWAWADEVLDRFSNDLGNLNAIAAGENRSKSASGPADYSPSAPGARCDYLVQYATVKIRWGLEITPRDFAVVEAGLEGCEVGGVPATSQAEPVGAAPQAGAAQAASAAPTATGCHPAYEPCLPDLPGDALNCGDLRPDQKPGTVRQPGTDPYRLDRDGDGHGCTD